MSTLRELYLPLVWKNLLNRKMRSYLTLVGIIIGITSLIAVLVLGQGLEKGVTDQFDKFGVRRIFVGPKSASGFHPPAGLSDFTKEDVDLLDAMPSLEYVSPIYMETGKVEFKQEHKNLEVIAYEPEDAERTFGDLDVKLLEGRWFDETDPYGIVIGYGIAKEAFDEEIRLKNSIKIDGKKFKVIGIKEEQGVKNQDYVVNMALDTLREIKNKPKAITTITATVKQGEDVAAVAKKLEDKLERKRGDKNFQVTTPTKIKEQTGEIMGIVQIIVAGIALISLIVGGIGIMNSMFTAVLERTREIGVMKALGATQRFIWIIFLLEAGFFGLIGGILGTVVGLGISYGLQKVINSYGLVKIVVETPPDLIFWSIVFSFLVGVISGLIPAVKASRLQPIEALRYE